MKNIFIYIFLILTHSSLSIADQRIVYIDIEYIINNSTAGKQINEHLDNIKNSKIDEFKSIEKNLKDKEKNLLAKKNIIDEYKFKSEISAIKQELKSYNDKRLKFAKSFDQKKINLTKIILESLNPIISEYVNKNEISLVLPKTNVIVGKKKLDITSIIIDDLNNKLNNININE